LGAGAAGPLALGAGVLVPGFSALFTLPAAGATGLAFGAAVGPLVAAGSTGFAFVVAVGPLILGGADVLVPVFSALLLGFAGPTAGAALQETLYSFN